MFEEAPGTDKTLGAEAAQLDPPAPGAAPEPAPAAAPAAPQPGAPHDYMGDAKVLVDFALDSLTPFFPMLGKVYTDDKRAALVPALGKVFQKYEFDLAAPFTRWEPEIRLALVAGPLIAPTIIAVRADFAAKKARDEAEAKEKAEGPPKTA